MGLQEQNEALLAQLHARERTIRALMHRTGASAADVAAFMTDADTRCVCDSRLILTDRLRAEFQLPHMRLSHYVSRLPP